MLKDGLMLQDERGRLLVKKKSLTTNIGYSQINKGKDKLHPNSNPQAGRSHLIRGAGTTLLAGVM
jgi:hypothetical protein